MPRRSKAHAALLTVLFALPGLPLQAWAGSEEYVLDPVHTRVMFAVEHAGFSKALGTVSGSTGGLVFDPEDPASASLDVSVPLQRLDLGDEKWNRSTLARNLLDADRYPTARFVSTRVQPLGDNRMQVIGLLTLRGETREVTLDAVFNALKRHPLPPFRRTAGFSATALISRSDFGISAWQSMIGDEVELRMEVEAVRGRIADVSAEGAPTAAADAADAAADEVPPADAASSDPESAVEPDLEPEPEPDLEPEPADPPPCPEAELRPQPEPVP